MALDARNRSSTYTKLVPLLGEDDANALMSQFPASDDDELVTRDHLRAEMAEHRTVTNAEFSLVRGEIGELRTEMVAEFATVRSEMHAGFATVRSEMHAGFATVRSEMHTGFATVRSEMHTQFTAVRADVAEVRTEVANQGRSLAVWLTGAVVAGMSAMSAIAIAVG
jgi:hypothetical protein